MTQVAVAAGANTSVTFAAGNRLLILGRGIYRIGPLGTSARPTVDELIDESVSVGPFDQSCTVTIWATTTCQYEILSPTEGTAQGGRPAIAGNAGSRLSGRVLHAALGDSITWYQIQSGATVNQVCFAAQGYLTWAMAFSMGAVWTPFVVELGNATPLLSYNRAVSGETAEQTLARLPEIDALPVRPRLCTVMTGTNNLTINLSQSEYSIAATIISICDGLLARGITPVLCTLLPRGNGTAAGWGSLTSGQITTARGRLMSVNRILRTYAGATPSVILADTFNALCNFSSATSDATLAWQPDYLHPNAPGAIRVGQVWWNAVKPFVSTAPDYYAGAGDVWSATDNPTGSLVTASFSAGGGTAGTGASGTVPANMTVNRLSGTAATVAVAQQARADGVNGFEMTLTMSGLTDNATFRSYEGTSSFTNANFAVGSSWYAEQDVIFNGTGANQFGNPDIALRFNAGPIQVFAALNAAGAQGDIQGNYTFRLSTPIFVIPAGGITSNNMWSVDGIKPTGSAVVTRRPPILRPYDRSAPGAVAW